MFHDGHSDLEGGILTRKKKQTPGREKNTRNESFKKAGGEATELQRRISLENVMGWVQS